MHIEFPGLVDIQVNGFAGIDFNSPRTTGDDLHEALEALRATGVTRALPTLVTGPFDRFAACARRIIGTADALIAGIHMEGPYISPADGPRGAHPREHVIAASRDDFARRQEAAGGRIVLVTLAPEVPGALDLIEHLASSGTRVAIGHSAAEPEVIHHAIAAGATLSTHLGNGCAAMLPRHHNVVWEQLAADELWSSLIVDGHHLPPVMVKIFMRVKPRRRTIIVTDAIAAAGCPPGRYLLGDVEVDLSESGRVSLVGTPFLAGSAATLPESIANAVRFAGVPLTEAVDMASAIPAEYLGIRTAGTVTAEWDPEGCRLTVERVTE